MISPIFNSASVGVKCLNFHDRKKIQPSLGSIEKSLMQPENCDSEILSLGDARECVENFGGVCATKFIEVEFDARANSFAQTVANQGNRKTLNDFVPVETGRQEEPEEPEEEEPGMDEPDLDEPESTEPQSDKSKTTTPSTTEKPEIDIQEPEPRSEPEPVPQDKDLIMKVFYIRKFQFLTNFESFWY